MNGEWIEGKYVVTAYNLEKATEFTNHYVVLTYKDDIVNPDNYQFIDCNGRRAHKFDTIEEATSAIKDIAERHDLSKELEGPTVYIEKMVYVPGYQVINNITFSNE